MAYPEYAKIFKVFNKIILNFEITYFVLECPFKIFGHQSNFFSKFQIYEQPLEFRAKIINLVANLAAKGLVKI
mgnify:CR=1 FL=1